MRIVKTVLRFLYAMLFIVAGVNHFLDEPFYMQIMPDYIPLELHRPAVIASGVAEIVLGLMLVIPKTMRWAAWGMIALLIAVFPANIFVFQHPEIFPRVSPELHLLRLPLQGVMIVWAWWYTGPAQKTEPRATEQQAPSRET